ncbi:S8 family serine peptidase [bacterium]|nr:S8 family serine peptidase [bacterium]
MSLRKFLLPVLALLCLSGLATAGEIAPGLADQLDRADGDDPIRAMVFMRDRVDVEALDLSLHTQKATLPVRHARVINELQDRARMTQADLLADLESPRASGQVLGYTSYWLVNGVFVVATKDVIYELAQRDDVEAIEPEMVPELIKPVEEYASTTTGIGITPGVVNINARRVWDELGIRGDGALIGSLDTGVDGNHPALAGRWRGLFAPASEAWLDVVYGGSTFPDDFNSHGTHTVGTMCGIAADDTIGVAPGAQWIASNAIDQGANPGFDSDILNSLQWFADPDGNPLTTDDVPDVVQNSWGVNENFSGYVDCDSRWWDAIDACEAAGVVLTWSAGNEGPGSTSLRSPADRATTLYNCFSVGSTITTPPFTISGFSSRGPAGPNCGPEENRVKPEISAPGSDVYSAVPGSGYGYKSGTSMAGPHVAGVVALMRSANPNLDVITIKQVLMETAQDLGTVGEDNTYGHGFLDAYDAVLAVMSGIGYLEGTIVDSDTGQPVEGAQVSVVDGYQSDVTDADGRFDLTLPQGAVELVVTRFGYLEGSYTVQIVEDETAVETFQFDPAPVVALSGRVYRPDGSLAAGAVVEALDVPVDPVTSGADGAYSIDLPVGLTYDVQAELELVGRVIEPVDLQGPTTLDLYLLPLGAHAEVSPMAFDETLLAGEQSSRILTVANLGADPLSWRLAAEELGGVPRQAVTPHDPIDLRKGEDDPRPGQSPVTGAGGPDQFGYVWVDSNEPGGPEYDWFDISGLGQTVGNNDDATYGPFDLGFSFPYYGDMYSQVSICTNGFITFESTSADPYTNDPMPSTGSPDLMVAPFWDDLNPSQGGDIYRYHDEANARYIVQWDGVPHYFSDGSFTFQVMLYESGVIVFQYNSLSYGNECTIGIENADASDGLQIVYNSDYVEDGMAILVSAGSLVPWLDYSPLAGTVGPDEMAEVSVMFDATELSFQEYLAELTLSSNDAEQSTMVLPVVLNVVQDVTAAEDLPLAFGLDHAAPNPFNPATTLKFSLPAAGHAQLKLYDVQGRLVRTLVDDHRAAGAHEVRWQGRDDAGRQVASGTYYARLIADGRASVRTLVLVK